MTNYLLSTGSKINLWSVDSNINLITEWRPPTSTKPLLDCCWSLNGRLVGCCSDKETGIITTYKLTEDLQNVEFNGELTKNSCCVTVTSEGRYVLAGRENGIITNFDMKTGKLQTTYDLSPSLNGQINAITMYRSDRIFATSSTNGDVFIVKTLTRDYSNPLPHSSTVNCLRFSFLTKNLITTGCSNGDVNLWDCNSKQNLHCFKTCHRAPVTAIAFSPINESFMISSSLDKKMIFYDTINHHTISQIMLDSPVTAVDIHSNGYTIVGGTTRGAIHVYDLRKFTTAVHIKHGAHDSSIKLLKFEIVEAFNKKKRINSSNSSNLPSSPVSTIKDNSLDIFSPVAEDPTKSNNYIKIEQPILKSPTKLLSSPLQPKFIKKQIPSPVTNQLQNSPTLEFDKEMASGDNGNHSNQSTHASKIFQKDEIREIIREEMEEMYSRLHRDIVSTSLNAIDTMFSYRNDIINNIQQNTINAALLKENQQLRNELNTLRQLNDHY